MDSSRNALSSILSDIKNGKESSKDCLDDLLNNYVEGIHVKELLEINEAVNFKHEKLLKIAFNVFNNEAVCLEDRISMCDILDKQISECKNYPYDRDMIDGLQRIALYNGEDLNYVYLAISMKSMIFLSYTPNEVTDNFLQTYYTNNIKKYLFTQNRYIQTPIRAFECIDRSINSLTKIQQFYLCLGLSTFLKMNYFFGCSDSTRYWQDILISIITKQNFINNEDSSKKRELIKIVSSFKNFIINETSLEFDILISDVLMTLINMQNLHNLSILEIYNILTLAQSSEESIELLCHQKQGDFLVLLEELKNIWLKCKCSITVEKRLKQKLMLYNLVGVGHILKTVSKEDQLDQLEHFLDVLANSFLSADQQWNILNIIKTENRTFSTLTSELYRRLAERLIQNEFPHFNGRNNQSYDSIKDISKLEYPNDKYHLFSGEIFDYDFNKKNILKHQLSSENYESANRHFTHLQNNLARLMSFGSLSNLQLTYFLRSLDSEKKVEQISKTFEIISEFGLNDESHKLLDIFNKSTENTIFNSIFNYAIDSAFKETTEKKFFPLSENVSLLKNIFFNNMNKLLRWIMPKSSQVQMKIREVMEMHTKNQVRDVQMKAFLEMSNSEGGRLAQINTGEGKTIIIAMLAAYLALHRGHKVDIITSSPLLAVPQSQDLEGFYSTLGLTVSHNIDNEAGYKADVCYGTMAQFQADVLYDEFRMCGTRQGRRFDAVILDEVDNALIEGISMTVQLTTPMPAMTFLQPILAAISIQRELIIDRMKLQDGQVYFVELQDEGDEAESVEYLINDPKQFIKESIHDYIKKITSSDESNAAIFIPVHLRQLVCEHMIPDWIDNAINAKCIYNDSKNYILRDSSILPVDCYHTGVVQENLQLSDALHQFLQIKHGVRLHPENLISNYISSVGFLERYENTIFGFTGTLGNERTKSFLNKIYKVDSVIIPPFKPKLHVELSPIVISSSKADWCDEIVGNTLNKLSAGRTVLIIMQYIKETEDLIEMFKKSGYPNSKILSFQTDNDVDVTRRHLHVGDVLITTNIAGRGTDLKLDEEAEEHGGLHVCLTFVPLNARVEEQNKGRTSRTGNRGTSQFIVYDESGHDIATIKMLRDKAQSESLETYEKQIEVSKCKDRIFKKFCNVLRNIKESEGLTKKQKMAVLEQKFAIWLRSKERAFRSESEDSIVKCFESFIESSDSTLIDDPFYRIYLGNCFVQNNKYDKAIKQYTLATELDKNFSENAHYFRAFSYIALYGNDVDKNKNQLKKAIESFTKARNLIHLRESELMFIKLCSDTEIFSQQVSHKLNIYNIQKQSINTAIGPDYDQLQEDINLFEEKLRENPQELKAVIDTMKSEMKKQGIIQQIMKKGYNINIVLESIDDHIPIDERNSYKDDIQEFKLNGLVGIIKLTEIKKTDWLQVCGTFFIGLAELVLGGICIIFLPLGFGIGIHLITGGIKDIINAIKVIFKGRFSWRTWAISKAMDLSLNLISIGCTALKGVVFGTKVLATANTKNYSLVAKNLGVEIAGDVGRTVISELCQYKFENYQRTHVQLDRYPRKK